MAYLKDGIVCFDDVFDVTIQTEAEKAQVIADNKEAQTKEKVRVVARQAVLDRLGITADEAALLLG